MLLLPDEELKSSFLSVMGSQRSLHYLLSTPAFSSLPLHFSVQIYLIACNQLFLTSTFPVLFWPADHRLPALLKAPVFWAVPERGPGPHPGWTSGPGCRGPGPGAVAQVTNSSPPTLACCVLFPPRGECLILCLCPSLSGVCRC